MDYACFNEGDPDFSEILGTRELLESPEILGRLKFDVTPADVMEPRFQMNPADLEKLKALSGYMFYIEAQTEQPSLMLLKIGKTDICSTVARIDDCPPEMLQRAVDQPVSPPVHGMYAITDEIKAWLRNALHA
ncbi:MAG: hypothetical protein OHK006_03880 [Thermodesulfovibrionales bacterium]